MRKKLRRWRKKKWEGQEYKKGKLEYKEMYEKKKRKENNKWEKKQQKLKEKMMYEK